jgi:hypothetical protein
MTIRESLFTCSPFNAAGCPRLLLLLQPLQRTFSTRKMLADHIGINLWSPYPKEIAIELESIALMDFVMNMAMRFYGNREMVHKGIKKSSNT